MYIVLDYLVTLKTFLSYPFNFYYTKTLQYNKHAMFKQANKYLDLEKK